MKKFVHAIVRQLHRLPWLRALAKRLATRLTIRQPFYGGVICLNAVEHSWAWTGDRTLEGFDYPLQNRLLELTASRPLLIDIGCNVGVMTLSVLLRDPHAKAVSIDPNAQAIALLNRSLRLNRLTHRAITLAAAVSHDVIALDYEQGGSFTGHVATAGQTVAAIPLAELLQRHLAGRAVVKIDIEGYESQLAETLRTMPAPHGCVFVIELHPLGYNGLGDPQKIFAALQSRGDATLQVVSGGGSAQLDPMQFHDLQVFWPDE